MAHDNLSDKIDSFLAAELSPEEMRAFKSKITRDPSLAEEVELHQMELEAMNELRRQGIVSRMPKWLETMDELPPPPLGEKFLISKKTFSSDILHWAMGVLLLLFVAGAFWFNRDKIFGNEKSVEPNVPTVAKPNAPVAKVPEKTPAKTSPETSKTENQVAAEKAKIENPKPEAVKTSPTAPEKFDEKYAALPTLAAENLGDLIASVDLPETKSSDRSETNFFNAARNEFSKKSNRNFTLIKNNLLQIPPDDFYYPYAMATLAEVYFEDKDYRMAVWSYEKYAAADKNAESNWRLLNFRLAAMPHEKARFWALLHEISTNSDQNYQAKAAKMKGDLAAKGIAE